MATETFPYVTVERYLEYDSNSERPSEYISGVIMPVEDGKPWHGLIIAKCNRRLEKWTFRGPVPRFQLFAPRFPGCQE
jgi:hypothetical protein